MPRPVTARSLLHGAVYSLQQCGLLLGDAKLLYGNGSYATAVAVALFANEELGRWRMLLKLRKGVVEGKSLTVKQVNAACEPHVDKQKAGVVGLALHGNSRAGELVRSLMKTLRGSKKYEEAGEQLDMVYEKILKRTPDDRHRLRMEAVYVDMLSEEQWNRPSRRITRTTAYECLRDTLNGYEQQRSHWYADLLLVRSVDQELHDALVQWSDRPELPPIGLLFDAKGIERAGEGSK